MKSTDLENHDFVDSFFKVMEDDEKQLKLIESLFSRMGAPQKQAHIMAAQLLKRAKQIAGEQEITLVEAVERLLKRVLEAQKTEING